MGKGERAKGERAKGGKGEGEKAKGEGVGFVPAQLRIGGSREVWQVDSITIKSQICQGLCNGGYLGRLPMGLMSENAYKTYNLCIFYIDSDCFVTNGKVCYKSKFSGLRGWLKIQILP